MSSVYALGVAVCLMLTYVITKVIDKNLLKKGTPRVGELLLMLTFVELLGMGFLVMTAGEFILWLMK